MELQTRSILVPEDIADWLKKNNINVSSLCRQLLREYINKQEQKKELEPKKLVEEYLIGGNDE